MKQGMACVWTGHADGLSAPGATQRDLQVEGFSQKASIPCHCADHSMAACYAWCATLFRRVDSHACTQGYL